MNFSRQIEVYLNQNQNKCNKVFIHRHTKGICIVVIHKNIKEETPQNRPLWRFI